jgi:hypothetical protein
LFLLNSMNKAIVSIVIGTIVILGGLVWLGQSTVNQNGSGENVKESGLKSDEASFDFGTISMANGKVNHEFKITNSSDQPVTIKKIYTSCMCTAASFRLKEKTYGSFGMPGHGGSALTTANITLNSGESGNLNVIYDPNAHGPAGVGAIDRFVFVEDKNGGQLKLEIKTVVTP